jgi:spore maturation protein CgeB
MKKHLRDLLNDPSLAAEITTHGLNTIRARHTCTHRVDELMAICETIAGCADARMRGSGIDDVRAT